MSDYLKRINRAIDLVTDRITEDLPLWRLAEAACFSPFHFHRIFKALMGESVKAFTLRVRLERALFLLKTNPRLTLKEVAADCGFASPSVFSRVFRRTYQIAPSAIDLPGFLHERKNRQEFPVVSNYYLRKFPAEETTMPVTIADFPDRPIAYLRAHNSYLSDAVPKAFSRVLSWAEEQGLSERTTQLIGLSHHDPEVTPLRKCSYDVALLLPSGTEPDAAFSRRRIPAGKFAVCRCRGDIHVIDHAWNYLYKAWLPRSRWQPANFPAMEVFIKWPRDTTTAEWDLEACVPIEPL